MKIEFGKEADIEKWMNLVNKVKSSFPGSGVCIGSINRICTGGFLIVLISAFYLSVIGLILFIGVICWKTNKIGGLLIITIGLVIFIMAAVSFRKMYLRKTK